MFVGLPRAGHDLGLGRDLVGVEHLVLDAGLRQQLREDHRLVDRPRADQHGPPLLVQSAGFLDDRLPFLVRRAEDQVG
jgi:hypothetical protein